MRARRSFGVLVVLAACRHAPADPGSVTTGEVPGVVSRERDACPDVPGTKDEGCPVRDLDGDRRVDGEDRCPDMAEVWNGYADDDGCPDRVPPELAAVIGAVPEVLFTPFRDTLEARSFAALDRVAEVLKKYPEVRIVVSAYIDVPGENAEMAGSPLSTRRAATVLRYFLQRGLAVDRFATGDTFRDRRAADRSERVELEILVDGAGVAGARADGDGDGVLGFKDACPEVAEVKNGVVDDDGCPDEVPPEVSALLGVVPGIEFKTNKWDLLPGSFAALDRIVEVLIKYQEVRVAVSVHIDAKGSAKYSRRVTQKRADSIKRYLVEHGVAAHRVDPRGYEEARPIADNKTADGRARNRRVELELWGN